MVARTVEIMDVNCVGFGSDLCQYQPDSVVEWMRNGTWTRETDFGEGSVTNAGFPPQPKWFKTNLDFINIIKGLRDIGFSKSEVAKIAGKNWLEFLKKSF